MGKRNTFGNLFHFSGLLVAACVCLHQSLAICPFACSCASVFLIFLPRANDAGVRNQQDENNIKAQSRTTPSLCLSGSLFCCLYKRPKETFRPTTITIIDRLSKANLLYTEHLRVLGIARHPREPTITTVKLPSSSFSFSSSPIAFAGPETRRCKTT